MERVDGSMRTFVHHTAKACGNVCRGFPVQIEHSVSCPKSDNYYSVLNSTRLKSIASFVRVSAVQLIKHVSRLQYKMYMIDDQVLIEVPITCVRYLYNLQC